MKRLVLHGVLADNFGAEWDVDVGTPAEALRAVEANKPGFAQFILDSGKDGVEYRVVLDDTDIDLDDLAMPFGRETIHLVPVISGEGGSGVGKVILGAVAIAASVFVLGPAGPLASMGSTSLFGMTTVASLVGNFGLSMVLSGVSQMLVGTPTTPSDTFSDSPAAKDSYVFSGIQNISAQGNPVPLGYGEAIIGSMVVSVGITAEAMPI